MRVLILAAMPLLFLACSSEQNCTSDCEGVSDTGSGGTSSPPETGGAPQTQLPASGGSTGASGGQPAGTGGNMNTTGLGSGDIVLRADFQAAIPGAYTTESLASDFGATPEWNNGVDEGRVVLTQEGEDRFITVNYPADEFGPGDGGVQFVIPFDASYEELYLAYRIRFSPTFDWVKGGKLPGLVGGTAPTGCTNDPDANANGFSARMMWRDNALPVQYTYYPTRESDCGDDYDYRSGGQDAAFTPGQWHQVQHRIVMNTPGAQDGVLQAWLDGVLVLDLQDFEWRSAGKTYGVDALYFSTFFGGGDASWAPSSPQHIDFDDFVVSTGP